MVPWHKSSSCLIVNRLSVKVSAPRMVITWLISGAKKRAAPDKRLKLQIGGLRFEVFQQPANALPQGPLFKAYMSKRTQPGTFLKTVFQQTINHVLLQFQKILFPFLNYRRNTDSNFS